jgi:hypothetical protein
MTKGKRRIARRRREALAHDRPPVDPGSSAASRVIAAVAVTIRERTIRNRPTPAARVQSIRPARPEPRRPPASGEGGMTKGKRRIARRRREALAIPIASRSRAARAAQRGLVSATSQTRSAQSTIRAGPAIRPARPEPRRPPASGEGGMTKGKRRIARRRRAASRVIAAVAVTIRERTIRNRPTPAARVQSTIRDPGSESPPDPPRDPSGPA